MASAEIGHDSLVDLASEKTFQAPDDLPFGSAVRRAACDVINGRLMVPHADDDGSIEGGVGVSVAAAVEAVAAGGHPGRGRDGTRAAELREGGVRTNPVGIIAEDDQQFGRGVGAHPEARTEGRWCLGREAREMLVVYRHFLGESHPAAGERPEGVLGGRGGRVDGARSESGAAREQAVIGEVVEGFSQDRALDRSPRRVECTKALLRRHASFDRSMILLHDVVHVLDRSVAATASQDSCLFHPRNCRAVETGLVSVDDAGLRTRRISQRLAPTPQGFLGHLIAREFSQEECRDGEARSGIGGGGSP